MLLTLIFALATTSLVYATDPQINLPPGQVSVEVSYPSANSYYDVILSDVPSSYHVTNGIYTGWCVDEGHYIRSGVTYQATLYSSYDPNSPHPDDDWDKVNYILNHPQGTPSDQQEAIWHFINNGGWASTHYDERASACEAMINAANAHGDGFVPIPGQIIAVVVSINSDTQVPIIEVTVPLQNVIPEYPFGPILGLITFIAAFGVFKYRHTLPKIFRSKHL